MRLEIIVGGNGQGKSTQVCKRLELVPNKNSILLLDVQNDEKFAKFPKFWTRNINEFKKEVLRTTNSVVVFEEATIFFPNRGYDKELVEAMIDRRHTKNYIIMVFHSFRAIPEYIRGVADFITILKTNDPIELVAKKFDHNEDVLKAFLKVKKGPQYGCETVQLLS